MNAHFPVLCVRTPKCWAARTEDEVYFMASRQPAAELQKIESFGWQLHQPCGGGRSTRVWNQIISTKNREIITSEFLRIHFQFSQNPPRHFHNNKTNIVVQVVRIACKVAASKDVWIFRHFGGAPLLFISLRCGRTNGLAYFLSSTPPPSSCPSFVLGHNFWLCKLVDSIRLCLHAVAELHSTGVGDVQGHVCGTVPEPGPGSWEPSARLPTATVGRSYQLCVMVKSHFNSTKLLLSSRSFTCSTIIQILGYHYRKHPAPVSPLALAIAISQSFAALIKDALDLCNGMECFDVCKKFINLQKKKIN